MSSVPPPGSDEGQAIGEQSSEGAAPKRKRGRPRDPGADRRILEAARAVAAEVGIQGASMSAIADRSGVGKPTIYLRWANRRDLMVAAVADLRRPVAVEHTGATRDDLLRALLDDRDMLVAGAEARFLRSVLFETIADPALAREFEEGIVAPRRARLIAILERGVEEGRIRSGIELGPLASMLAGPLLTSMVVGGAGVEPDALGTHVDVIVDGIGTPASSAAQEIHR